MTVFRYHSYRIIFAGAQRADYRPLLSIGTLIACMLLLLSRDSLPCWGPGVDAPTASWRICSNPSLCSCPRRWSGPCRTLPPPVNMTTVPMTTVPVSQEKVVTRIFFFHLWPERGFQAGAITTSGDEVKVRSWQQTQRCFLLLRKHESDLL